MSPSWIQLLIVVVVALLLFGGRGRISSIMGTGLRSRLASNTSKPNSGPITMVKRIAIRSAYWAMVSSGFSAILLTEYDILLGLCRGDRTSIQWPTGVSGAPWFCEANVLRTYKGISGPVGSRWSVMGT